MNIFDFFKNKTNDKKEDKEAPIEIAIQSQLLTITPNKDIFTAYDEIFFKEMSNLKGFSSNDINSIHKIITTGEDGFLNQARYYKEVFDNFFKEKNWIWVEFEEWHKIFIKLNEFPTSWNHNLTKPYEVELSEIVKK